MINDTFNRISYVTLRPLSGGIDVDTPPHQLPVGTFRRLENVMVRRGGLERRGGYGNFYDDLPSLDWKVYASPMWYDDFGSPVSLLVTNKHLYRVDNGPELNLISPKIYESLTGYLTAFVGNAQLYTLSNDYEETMDFLDVYAGDTVWIGGTTSGFPYEIVSVNVDTLVIRDHDGTLTAPSAELTYTVVEGFRRVPDWTVLRQFDGEMYFVWTDNASRPIKRYNGTSVSTINGTGADGITVNDLTESDTVTAFGNRLWIGGMSEDSRDERFRIRWTTVLNQDTFPLNQYVDLPVRRFGIRRLLPLGNLLVVYFEDGVYFGRPTNIVGLPYDFTPYDTGNIGLVGPRAITSWLDAHWFVGQDDIYSFSASRALERIGTRVVRDTINNPNVVLRDTIVTPDPVNERIVFQFFDISGNVPLLWCYYYKTQSWATEPFFGQSVFYGRTVGGVRWNTITPGSTWEDSKYFVAWLTARPVVSQESLYRSEHGSLRIYLTDARDDVRGSTHLPIRVIIESGDFDFDKPNVVKCVTQLAMKLEAAVDTTTVFQVQVANNRGEDYRSVGDLVVDPGQDEGKVDFRLTGSLFRFRLTTEGTSRPWLMNEIVLVASEVGRESVFV